MESMEDIFVTSRQPTAEEENYHRHLVVERKARLNAITPQLTVEVDEDLKRYYYLALSPIRRLPRDILSNIFMACLTDQYPTMSNKEAPMVLTQICSVMRHVALNTPALWATLHISVDHNSALEQSSKRPVPVSAVQEWLERSEPLPLRICLNHTGPVPFIYDSNPYVDEILQVIASFSLRWHTLQISIPTELSTTAISRLTEKDVPRLRHILLPCHNTVPHEQDDLRDSSILSASTLVGLHLYGEANISEFPAVKWRNLTHIGLPWSGWGVNNGMQESVVEVLQQTRRLTSLHLHVRGDTAEHIISLPFLKTLEIVDYCDRESHSVFIGSIKAPSLKCLTYNEDPEGIGRTCPLTRLPPLLKGSPFLRKLTLGRVTSTTSLKQCLSDCPTLEVLIITNVGSERRSHSNRFLMALVSNKMNRCLCPNLEYLRCVEGIHRPSPNVLNKFLSRKRAGGPSHLRPWKGLTITIIAKPVMEYIYDKIISGVQADKHIAIGINADDFLLIPSWQWHLHSHKAYRVGWGPDP